MRVTPQQTDISAGPIRAAAPLVPRLVFITCTSPAARRGMLLLGASR